MSAFDDSKKAVDSAAEAFKTWQFTSPAAKAAIFRKAAEIIKTDKYADKITQSVVEETACGERWARIVNVEILPGFLFEAAEAAYTVKGEILPSDVGAQSFVQKLPMGVM